MFWHKRTIKPTVKPGLFIPRAEQLPALPPTKSLMVRPTMSLVVVASLAVLMIVGVQNYTEARFMQAAAPIIVYSQNEPYQQTALAFGPNERLADPTAFAQMVQALTAASNTVLVVDVPAATIEMHDQDQVLLVADIAAVTSHGGWRYVPSGVYTVMNTEADRYSTLEQQYYPHSVLFGNNYSIHGTPYQVGTTTVNNPVPQGVQISNSAAQDIFTLSDTNTVVVVRNQTNIEARPTVGYQAVGPAVPARAYLVADIESGDILTASESTTIVPIASLTKLMTALLVVETYDLEETITLDQELYVTTLIPRLEGNQSTSIFDLLQLLLLESSNEAAEVLATNIGRDLFIVKMNELAEKLQLADTTFTDPSGLDDGNVSSAEDLLTLTQYIYERYPFILAMTTEERFMTVARHNDFTDLSNFNTVAELDTFAGGKIGETLAAKQTSVTIHNLVWGDTTRPVAIVLLGSDARDRDVTELHNWVQTQFFVE